MITLALCSVSPRARKRLQASAPIQSNSSAIQPESYSNSSSSASQNSTGQSPFYGSVPEGKASPYVLSLSIKDAMERGLRNNLGLLLESDNTHAGAGRKMEGTQRPAPERECNNHRERGPD